MTACASRTHSSQWLDVEHESAVFASGSVTAGLCAIGKLQGRSRISQTIHTTLCFGRLHVRRNLKGSLFACSRSRFCTASTRGCWFLISPALWGRCIPATWRASNTQRWSHGWRQLAAEQAGWAAGAAARRWWTPQPPATAAAAVLSAAAAKLWLPAQRCVPPAPAPTPAARRPLHKRPVLRRLPPGIRECYAVGCAHTSRLSRSGACVSMQAAQRAHVAAAQSRAACLARSLARALRMQAGMVTPQPQPSHAPGFYGQPPRPPAPTHQYQQTQTIKNQVNLRCAMRGSDAGLVRGGGARGQPSSAPAASAVVTVARNVQHRLALGAPLARGPCPHGAWRCACCTCFTMSTQTVCCAGRRRCAWRRTPATPTCCACISPLTPQRRAGAVNGRLGGGGSTTTQQRQRDTVLHLPRARCLWPTPHAAVALLARACVWPCSINTYVHMSATG